MHMKHKLFLLYAMLSVVLITACEQNKSRKTAPAGKIQIVTSLFPIFDFTKTIVGDKGTVFLLLPPGMEPHGFEPKPEDIVRIYSANMFVFTNRYMEPWADRIIGGIDKKKTSVIDAGTGIEYQKIKQHQDADEHGHSNKTALDPHIWLDFSNAAIMVDNIMNGVIAVDPVNADYYRKNAQAAKERLTDLDKRYSSGLAKCATRVMVHGGHYTFGYLAARYNLEYYSLSGISSESEPSAARMTSLIKKIKSSGVSYIFAEELLSPRLTETLANEAGVKVLRLNGAHNLSKQEFERGQTFIGFMDQNLILLQQGLACNPK